VTPHERIAKKYNGEATIVPTEVRRREGSGGLFGARERLARGLGDLGRDRFRETDAGHRRHLGKQIDGAFEVNFLVRWAEEEARMPVVKTEDAGSRTQSMHQLQGRFGAVEAESLAENDDLKMALLQP
jgi:hypothetical protein